MREHIEILNLIIMIKAFLIFCLSSGLISSATSAADTCGDPYESCNLGDPTKLNVHLVPHTHDDVGWLKTVDQYYYGANQTIQGATVQYILDTVIPRLIDDKSRRFIYVEMAFFERWWRQQDDNMRANVQMLVQERRLEFILGGWCMNDEAATHYNAIIDQMTVGLQFINDTFGPCARPLVAWQIDPFGHSREQASLFAQMGFDGLFFGRLDFDDKAFRSKEKRMEEIWRGSASLDPPAADLFTGVNENGYSPPKGFCFDEYCADEPIMDDPRLEGYNVDGKVKDFINISKTQAEHFKTNHIMMTMGSDFQYSNAYKWYKNLDKLIKYVNAAKDSGISVFYSTPSCYLYALNKASSSWTVKTDDFFPYADAPHQFWTGYFTSRPALKGYVRETNKVLQVCKQLETKMKHFGNGTKSSSVTSEPLREAMGVAQHHDAVSGTEKQHVANDYAKRLYKGREVCKQVISTAITGSADGLHFCDYLNISHCDFTQQNNPFTVVVYNPIGRSVSTYVRIPASPTMIQNLKIVDKQSGKMIASQYVPVALPTKLARGRNGVSDSEIVFRAENITALGYSEYEIRSMPRNKLKKYARNKPVFRKATGGDITIANEFYKVVFDGTTGLMKTIANTESGLVLHLTQEIYWYNSSVGNNISLQQSGAYVFRPNSSNLFKCDQGNPVETWVLEPSSNSQVQEVVQKFSDWAWQVVRLYSGERHVEVEWTIGPIPYKDGLGKEIISKTNKTFAISTFQKEQTYMYSTKLVTDGKFYTDSNGREMLERKRDFRPTWKLNQTEPIAGNYYPVNSRIYIKDNKNQFTIVTDRSQGGSSIQDGSVELMLHRRVFGDDHKGVGEPLNETGQFGDGLIVRGKQYLMFDNLVEASKHHRILAEEIYMSPLVAFSANSSSVEQKSLLTTNLPKNVHLLTLSNEFNDGSILIRLEHQFEKGDDSEYSKPVTVNLKNIFVGYQVSSMEELVLGANALKKDVVRLNWTAAEEKPGQKQTRKLHFQDPYDVTLNPMQIRTFKLTVLPDK